MLRFGKKKREKEKPLETDLQPNQVNDRPKKKRFNLLPQGRKTGPRKRGGGTANEVGSKFQLRRAAQVRKGLQWFKGGQRF